MQYRKLGNSSIEFSAITFGAWAAGGWMWGATDRKKAVDAIMASFHEGVTSIDTAPIYGMGVSEEIVGEAVKNLQRDKVQILTKFGMRWDLPSPKGDFMMQSEDNFGNPVEIYKYAGKESVIKEVEDSLKRLQTDYIDLLQLHWPDSTTPIDETMETLEILLQQGKIRAAGVSNYSVEQVKKSLETVQVISDQVPYSMLNRAIEKELVPFCIENNLGIIAYSPLERGLLTGKYSDSLQLHEKDHRLSYFKKFDSIPIQSLLNVLREIAHEKSCTISQLVLKWTSEQPGISIILAGARNAEQAVENAQSVRVEMDRETDLRIQNTLNSL